jgi:hypothetical protein
MHKAMSQLAVDSNATQLFARRIQNQSRAKTQRREEIHAWILPGEHVGFAGMMCSEHQLAITRKKYQARQVFITNLPMPR